MSNSKATKSYLEKLKRDDFTFFVPLANNERLLFDKFGGQRNIAIPLRHFSLEIKDDLKKSGTILINKLRDARSSVPGDFWKPLCNMLPKSLQRDLASAPKKRGVLLTAIVNWLNKLLEDESLAFTLGAKHAGLPPTMKNTFGEMLPSMQILYRNRRLLDRLFKEAIKPLPTSIPFTEGRGLIAHCYGNRCYLSVSYRKQPTGTFAAESDSGTFLLGIADYCRVIYSAVFGIDSKELVTKKRDFERRGLLIVSGATNTSKSQIARGLIHEYLKVLSDDNPKRNPHLITFEDPIEVLYEQPPVFSPLNPNYDSFSMFHSTIDGVDYTPREKGENVEDLKSALKDALRQTPTVFYVGETREKEDWKKLVEFAGTGHLVVTTSHAGSLTEAMQKLFDALEIKTPSQISALGSRLLGVIHIKQAMHKTLLPAAWRQTPTGRSSLTAEGLSSILPNKPGPSGDEKGCLGRYWFATNLGFGDTRKNIDIVKQAIKWDLEGV